MKLVATVSGCSLLLLKARNPKLVQKQVTVHGPHGTHQRMAWVLPGGDGPAQFDLFDSPKEENRAVGPSTAMFLRVEGAKHLEPVSSLKEASEKFAMVRDRAGSGASNTPRVEVVDANHKVIGVVSYNGRIWAPEDYGKTDAGIKPIYDTHTDAERAEARRRVEEYAREAREEAIKPLPEAKMKNYGWDRVKLADAYTVEDLVKLRGQVEKEHSNPKDDKGQYVEGGKPTINLYNREGRKKLDNIAWAITYRMKQDKENGKDASGPQAVAPIKGIEDMVVVPSISERPKDIPEGWVILNAPRPLAGDKTWQGDFIAGRHYAAINPESPEAEKLLALNKRDAANVVEYTNKGKLIAAEREKLLKEYPEMKDDIAGYSDDEIYENYQAGGGGQGKTWAEYHGLKKSIMASFREGLAKAFGSR